MKNGIIHISAFVILDEIAKKKGVKNREWAKASWGNSQYVSRISELRKLANLRRLGATGNKVGRALSADKVQSLLNGLKAILGGEIVKKELIEKLSRVKTEREKNLILVMAASEEEQKSIRLFIETLIDKKKG